MDVEHHLRALQREGRSFAASANIDLRRAVHGCPGWTVADLCWHMTRVHDMFQQSVGDGVRGFENVVRRKRPDDERLMDAYVEGFERLMHTLSASDPDELVWTWAGDKTVAWAVRRAAHETAVHAWDARDASGAASAIEADLASDGIDEFLENFLPLAREGVPFVGGSVHIHCTDVPGEWMVREGDALTLVVTREHAKGTAAIRGDASDVLLALWRRRGTETLEIIGSAEVADRFLQRTSL